MSRITEMTREKFADNLLLAISEIKKVDINKVMFKIVPQHEPNKPLNAIDEQMRLIVLSEENIGSRILSFDETATLLSCNRPLVPIWINVSLIPNDDEIDLFELKTSLRMRKPSLLQNTEMGYPPFKVIK